MALYEVDKDNRYIDYTDRWANFHQWTPRNGINRATLTTNAAPRPTSYAMSR